MRGSLCCDRGVAGALCSFGVVVAARGRLVGGHAVAHIGSAGFALVVYGCVVVVLSPALRVAGFVAVASCALPDGPFVLLSGVLRHWRSVAVVWWCIAPLMVGRVVVVCGPPHGVAWCGGVWPPSWWGVLWWCVVPLMVGCDVVVCGPLHAAAWRGGAWPLAGGEWCGGVWHPSRWRVLRWCVAPLMVGLCCVMLCCAALRCVVLCCVALYGVVVCGSPHGGVCCIGVWPPAW